MVPSAGDARMKVTIEHECRVCGFKIDLEAWDESFLAIVADECIAHHCKEPMMWRYVQ